MPVAKNTIGIYVMSQSRICYFIDVKILSKFCLKIECDSSVQKYLPTCEFRDTSEYAQVSGKFAI